MKTLKLFGLLVGMFTFQTGLCQIDLFMDEDEVEEFNINSEFIMDNYSFKSVTDILKKGEAGPIGNWAGETLELMTDPRFVDAPQEYLMAFQVKIKVLKVKAFNAALEKLNLDCEERKQLIQSYLLFLGTLYLDMYSMDYFNEKSEYSDNELYNIELAGLDAEIKFALDKYDRVGIWNFKKWPCENDLTDPNITDCNCNACYEKASTSWANEVIEATLEMDVIHPVQVSKLLVDLQTMLNALPCKD